MENPQVLTYLTNFPFDILKNTPFYPKSLYNHEWQLMIIIKTGSGGFMVSLEL